jgi:DNA-binding MarR family transcriptional regulator
LIKRARRQMANAIRERLEPVGTSLPAVQIIRRIALEGQLNQLELARQIELEPAALCRLLVDLEAKGLVVRRRDSGDNRRVLVAVTPNGAALLARAQPHLLGGVEEMVSRLTRSEQSELSRLLEKLAPEEERPPEREPDGAPKPPTSPRPSDRRAARRPTVTTKR